MQAILQSVRGDSLSGVFTFSKKLLRAGKFGYAFISFICALMLNISAQAQTLTTVATTPASWCASSGGPVSVVWSQTDLTGAAATLLVYLSNPNGTFNAAPPYGTFVGSVSVDFNSTTSGTIPGTVPASQQAGSIYKIRVYVLGSDQGDVAGSDNLNGNLSITTGPAQPSAISGPDELCSGSQEVYSVPQGAGVTFYEWTLPDDSWTGTSSTFSINATAGLSDGDISVIAHDACGASIAQTKTITVTTGAPALPDPAIFSQQFNLCGGGSTDITLPSQPGATFIWVIPEASTHLHLGSVVDNTATVNVDAGMEHEQVWATASNGCGESGIKLLNLWSQPTKLIVTGPPCVTANQQNVVFTVTNPEVGSTYEWKVWPGIEIVSGQGTPELTVNWKKGDGQIAVKATNNCGSTATTRYFETICPSESKNSISSQAIGSQVRVYPNPVSSSTKVEFTANKAATYVIELSDRMGRGLQRKELIANPGENSFTIDLSKYTNGTYMLNVVGEGQRQRVQIVKAN